MHVVFDFEEAGELDLDLAHVPLELDTHVDVHVTRRRRFSPATRIIDRVSEWCESGRV